MEASNLIIFHPTSKEEVDALKAFAKALKIKFEISSDKVYNTEFIDKIKRSKKEYEQGDFVTIANEDLDSFLGL